MGFVVVCAAVFVIAAVAVCVVVVRNQQAEFNERFPPISDAEFVARCKPGTDPEVALKVRRIVAEHFAVAYDRVHPEMTFVEDIGAD
jgi:hypothetical protein